jgi:seryl-tRNA synthetase
MTSPDTSNNFEKKSVNAQNIDGNFTYTTVKGDHNITTVSVGENIQTRNEIISRLDPEFSKEIIEFRDLLKELFKDKQATEEKIVEINKDIDKLAKELEGVPADQIIENEDKKDNIKTKFRFLSNSPEIWNYFSNNTGGILPSLR